MEKALRYQEPLGWIVSATAVFLYRSRRLVHVCRCTRCICMTISASTRGGGLVVGWWVGGWSLSHRWPLFRFARCLGLLHNSKSISQFLLFSAVKFPLFFCPFGTVSFFLRWGFAGGFSNVMIFPSNSILPCRWPTHSTARDRVFRSLATTRDLCVPSPAGYVICPEPIDNRHFYMKRNAV